MSSLLRIYAFFYVFFILPHLLFSQDTTVVITGKVIDASTSEPIVFATVTLQESEQDTASIVAFTETDEQGYFDIDIEKISDSLTLRIGLIGYETIKIAVRSIKSDTLFISLNQESILIKEVVIIESGKIIQTTDTITYIADRFRDSTENNLEDLLIKLPGVEVSKDGKISVNGKEIKKILVDGDDMSGKNYQIMSKNLTADIIDKIQVIDRFSDNPLLKGLTNTNDQVINITVKQEKQNQLIPGGQVGIGNDNRHNHQFRLFGLFSKTKLLTTARLNTIGETNYYDTGEREITIPQSDALLNDELSEVISADGGMKSAPYYRFNTAATGSIRFTLHPWKNVKITAWSNFDKEIAKMFSNTKETYRLLDSTLYIIGNNTFRDDHTQWNAHLNLQINLSSHSSLQIVSNFFKNNASTSAISDIYQLNISDSNLFSELTNYITTTQNRINYTLRINEKRAFVWDFLFSKYQKNQHFEWSSDQPLSVPFSENIDNYLLYQYVKTPLQVTATNAQMIWSEAFGGNLTVSLGALLRKELLLSDLSIIDSTRARLNNDLNYNQSNIYIGFNWKKQIGKYRLFLSSPFGYAQSKIINLVDNNKKKANYTDYYMLPSIGMISKSKSVDLLATYTFNYQLPKIIDLYEGYILSDLRTFSRGASVYVPESSHILTINYRFQNFENYYNAPAYFINTLISRSTGGYQYRYEFENTSQLNQKIRNLFPTNNTLIAGGVEQYVPFLLSTIKFRPTLSWTTYTNRLNDTENRENQSFSSTLNFTMRSGFKPLFNFALGISPSWNIFKTRSSGAINTFRSNQTGGYVDLYFNFKKEVEFRLENEFFSFQNQQQIRQGYVFVNAYVGYSIKEWNTKIGLRIKNIGNSAGLVNNFANDIYTVTRTIQLLPRYILLEINFRG